MRTAIAIALTLTLGAGGAAHAQGCHTVSMSASDVHVESVKLFDRDGKLQGRLAKSALPSRFDVSDCGDQVYLMLPYQGVGYFVRKTELGTREMTVQCICLPPGAKPPTLSAPG